jgi:hypothetical protein
MTNQTLPIYIVYRDGNAKRIDEVNRNRSIEAIQNRLSSLHDEYINDSLCDDCDSPLGVFVVENGQVNLNY